MHQHTGSSRTAPLCPCLMCYRERGGRLIDLECGPLPDDMNVDVPAMLDQIATLRADLAASQREVERLRKIFDDAGHGEHNVLALVDHYQDEAIKATSEVERCRGLIEALTANACSGDGDAVPLDNCGMPTNADALRYLASIGRVEIVSEQGRRVVARWVK